MELVSVVIPIYNAQRTIVRTMESVYCQTYPAIEWILLNDGSKDNSMELVRNFLTEHGIEAILIDRENRGVSYTRNEGIRRATGTYVAFLDADDQWMPDKLQAQVECMEETGADLVSCQKTEVSAKTPVSVITLKQMLFKNHLFTSGVMAKRQVLLDVGGFDEKMQYGEDYHLWLRIVQKYDVRVINRHLMIYEDGTANPRKNGLSTNLKAMEKAELSCYKMLRQQKKIGLWLWLAAVVYSWLRYGRRCLLQRKRK